MKKFLETIPRLNKDAEKNAASQRDSSVNNQEVGNSNKVLKLNTSSKLFLGGDSTDNDSTDELWGDPDNSFIVKATQELDSISKIGATNNPICEDLVSTIPETVPSEVMQTRHSCEGRLTLDEYSSLFEELSNVDWDSEMEEWDNGFLIGEDELSEIPEDVLSGTVLSDKVQIVTASKENAVMKEKNAALYNSFEDESFEDESLLCQPDVLSKIDEVESKY
ncbi:uncharacterized protein CEXT_694201 [Caerostris extrusa]|uniref:Uncharacterized protein n=1 Tax=Caerostris extrusa TaxID=172846 RepID=A0AAV4WQX3_CAEEX|nr:uncharacterized protein CEXT_694201 [Caerostris extrusa]